MKRLLIFMESDVNYTTHLPAEKSFAKAVIRLDNKSLKALLAANFAPSDLVVTLAYADASRPKTFCAAENRIKLFIRCLSAELRADGRELKYVYVTDSVFSYCYLHHHLILNATGQDYDTIGRLWQKNGDYIAFSLIRDKGYDGWARYLSKALSGLMFPLVNEDVDKLGILHYSEGCDASE